MESQPWYRNGSGISWFGLLVGVALGIGAGLLYAWRIDPVIETNTAPWQLGDRAREEYVVAVALSYAHNQDLTLAFDRLRALRPDQNVWQMVADIACERHKTVQVRTNTDVLAMRALEQLYRAQGASGCADAQYPTPAPVRFSTPTPSMTPFPSLTPPPTKTATPPLPASALQETPIPTRTPVQGTQYIIAQLQPFCDADLDGVIEIRVFDRTGQPVAGVPITVRWGGENQDVLYTGLKPNREASFADYQMERGRTYLVSVPGLVSDPRPIEAVECGDGTITSYWVNFQQR